MLILVFYEDLTPKESLFGKLANQHPRLLNVKLGWCTKEEFVWGFQGVGFVHLADGTGGDNNEVLTALEKKTWDYPCDHIQLSASVTDLCC